MVDAVLKKHWGFVGNVSGTWSVGVMNPERKTVGAIVGCPKGGGLGVVISAIPEVGPIHIWRMSVDKGIPLKDKIATGIGGMGR